MLNIVLGHSFHTPVVILGDRFRYWVGEANLVKLVFWRRVIVDNIFGKLLASVHDRVVLRLPDDGQIAIVIHFQRADELSRLPTFHFSLLIVLPCLAAIIIRQLLSVL